MRVQGRPIIRAPALGRPPGRCPRSSSATCAAKRVINAHKLITLSRLRQELNSQYELRETVYMKNVDSTCGQSCKESVHG